MNRPLDSRCGNQTNTNNKGNKNPRVIGLQDKEHKNIHMIPKNLKRSSLEQRGFQNRGCNGKTKLHQIMISLK